MWASEGITMSLKVNVNWLTDEASFAKEKEASKRAGGGAEGRIYQPL